MSETASGNGTMSRRAWLAAGSLATFLAALVTIWGFIGPHMNGAKAGPAPATTASASVAAVASSPGSGTGEQSVKPADSDVPAAFTGRWKGSVLQPNSATETQYPVKVTVKPGELGETVASVSYPTLKCDADWTLQDSSASQLRLVEHLTRNDNGSSGCVDGVLIALVKKGSGVEMRFYSADSNYTGVPGGRADLRKS